MSFYLGTTDKLRLTPDSAANLDVIAHSMDTNAGVVTVNTPHLTFFSSAVIADIVPSPLTGVRNVTRVNIRNRHATLSVTVLVTLERSGTPSEETKVTLAAGDEYTLSEGVDWFRRAASASTTLMRVLSADATGQNIATVQPWFPSTGSATVVGGTSYYMYGMLSMTRTAGVTSHTTGMGFGGTHTLTSITYRVDCNIGDVDTTATDGPTLIRVATNTAVKAASTSATEAFHALIAGIVRINAGGTFIPQFTYSAIPGGAPSIRSGTYIFLQPIGSGSVTAAGPWS